MHCCYTSDGDTVEICVIPVPSRPEMKYDVGAFGP